MRSRSICVLGGTGFVGSHLVARMTRDGHRVRVLTRSRDRNRHLQVLPGVELVEADVYDPAALETAFRGCDTAVNLVGILNERGYSGAGFERAHAELTRKVLAAAHAAGVTRLLQMSSLQAGETAPSHYLRSKGRAEASIRAAGPGLQWTILQPSVIFGPDDSFTNRFASLVRIFPFVPLARAGARFAPVYIGDVVEAFARALGDRSTHGKTLQLYGPDVVTLAELVRYVAKVLGLGRLVVGLPDAIGWLQAAALGCLPGKPLSLDNFRSLQLDSVGTIDGLAALGITPSSLRVVVPTYLGTTGREAQLDAYRRSAGSRDGEA